MIELVCLANVLYNEARVDDMAMRAVAHVVINRTKESGKSICSQVRTGFAAKSSTKKEIGRWKAAIRIASSPGKDFTGGATYFHTHSSRPYWSYKFRVVYKDKWHVFYKP